MPREAGDAAGPWRRPLSYLSPTATAEGESLESLASGLNGALDQACANPEIYTKALDYPEVLLELSGVVLPPGVDLLTFSPKDLPFEPTGPAIELTHCRVVWACDKDDSALYEEGKDVLVPCIPKANEVCFGFRLVDGR